MADQTLQHNNGRPHHNTGAIGDGLNRLSDEEYWAAHGAWYQKPGSQHMSFEEYVRMSDEGLREQARHDEENARHRDSSNGDVSSRSRRRGVRSESSNSVSSDDSLYSSPNPIRTRPAGSPNSHARHAIPEDEDSDRDVRHEFRHGDHAGASNNQAQNPGRLELESPDENVRQTTRSTAHPANPSGFDTDALDDEALSRLLANPPPDLLHQATASRSPDPHQGDALDDEALARLLANPPPEMLEQATRASVPGALDDAALERLLKQQQEEIYEGGWRQFIQEAPSPDHLDDEAYRKFLANEQDKVFNGETEAFPVTARHPDALDDDELAKVIANLGFERHPAVQPERGESSSRAAFTQSRQQPSRLSANHAEPVLPNTPAPPYEPETLSERDQAFSSALDPEPLSYAERSYREQTDERRRRQNAIQRRRDTEQDRDRMIGAEAEGKGKQPERYYE